MAGFKRILLLWISLGVVYVAIETIFRGYSHPSMLVVGGLCGVLVGSINQNPRFYQAPVIVQSVIGAFLVLIVEFLSGCILNLWLGLGVWDYSNQPGNILGQVCPVFGLLWLLIMPLAIWGEDTAVWMIWFYDKMMNRPAGSMPTLKPYSLGSIYKEFFTGR